jgi:hypothetical protein
MVSRGRAITIELQMDTVVPAKVRSTTSKIPATTTSRPYPFEVNAKNHDARWPDGTLDNMARGVCAAPLFDPDCGRWVGQRCYRGAESADRLGWGCGDR